MTYCLGMLLRDGLIIMADTRTNAGVDNFSSFRKLHVLADAEERRIYAASAGSLSVSQTVIGLIEEDQLAAETGELGRCLAEAPSMFRVVQLVGEAVQRAGDTIGAALEKHHIDSEVELLVGGRVGEGPLKLFLVYSAGNFIECTAEVPFVQIGETKYGRPILDRALTVDTSLDEAVKIGLLSFDSTMKSNLGVGRPIDVVVLPSERGAPPVERRIGVDDPYFEKITASWAASLRKAVHAIPNPDWLPRRH